MIRKILLSLLVAAVLSCSKESDPVPVGEYYVTNSTTKVIFLKATRLGGAAAILHTNVVAVGEKAHIYTYVDQAKGPVSPSHALLTFTVYSETEDPANIIYANVDNADWVPEGTNSKGGQLFHLTIR